MQEIWKDIPWYEWLYQASNLWRIMSLDRKVLYVRKERFYKWRILTTTTKSYVFVHLSNKNKERKRLLAHRVIAQLFIPNHENKPFINHKNWIRNDNRVENLEWCTCKDNNRHAYFILKKQSKLFFENNPAERWAKNKRSKKVNQYTLEWEFIKTWDSIWEATRWTWILQPHICQCCKWNLKYTWWYKWAYS